MAKLGKGIMAKRRAKWKELYIFQGYELARDGLSDLQISKTLGVSYTALKYWIKTKPLFRQSLEFAREYRAQRNNFDVTHHIYYRLPERLKILWQKLDVFNGRRAGITEIEHILEGTGRRTRQHLFLCALTRTNFNKSMACKMVGIDGSTLHAWKQDPKFLELMGEIQEIKKDLYEDALLNLVRMGDTTATIHANKTLNRDRGYGQEIALKVEGNITHTHNHHLIGAEELSKLSLQARQELLKVIRKKQTKQIESTVVGRN